MTQQEYLALVAKAGESKSDYAYTPDDNPSSWKLNISDATHVGGAIAALGPGGFRGQKVQIPTEALAGVKAKVRAAWKKFHPDETEVPNVIKEGGPMKATMTPEEMVGELEKLQGQLDETSKRADRFEAVTKLTAEERAVFEKLDAKKQDEYLKADATARKDFAPDETDEGGGEGDAEEMPPEVQKRMDSMQVEFQKALDKVKKEADDRITKAEDIAKAERTAREKVEFAKRAEKELACYSGTPDEKGALLGALCNGVHKTLTKEEVDGLQKMLAAGNEALSKLMEPVGKDNDGGKGGDPEARLEALVNKYMADNPKVDKGTAWMEVAKANPKLYDEIDAKRA